VDNSGKISGQVTPHAGGSGDKGGSEGILLGLDKGGSEGILLGLFSCFSPA